MKLKGLIFILPLFFLITLADGETNGYLSFEFVKGQSESSLSRGTFQNVQLGLIFSGGITNKINYNSEIRFKYQTTIEIEQAYVRMKPSDSFSLSLGLYLVPFGRYNCSNRPHQTMLVKPPLSVENLYPSSWRDIGVLIEGNWRGFFYSAYLGNGLAESKYLRTGQQFQDNNKNKGKGGRVGLSLSRGFEVAFSYYKGKYDNENERNLSLKGVDLSWVTEGFQIVSEYSKADLENPPNLDKGKAEGYFVQLSFKIEALQPVLSYQRFKYEDIFHGQDYVSLEHGGEGISEEKSRWTLGIIYFASTNVLFKAEYEFNKEKKIELRNNLLLLQMALSF